MLPSIAHLNWPVSFDGLQYLPFFYIELPIMSVKYAHKTSIGIVYLYPSSQFVLLNWQTFIFGQPGCERTHDTRGDQGGF